jgi:hypothetical protein
VSAKIISDRENKGKVAIPDGCEQEQKEEQDLWS